MAVTRLFSDAPLPDEIVVDSSFIFEALIDHRGTSRNPSFYHQCREFATRLFNQQVRLIYSPLLFLEAPRYWRRLYSSGDLLSSAQLFSPTQSVLPIDDSLQREWLFKEADNYLDDFLSLFFDTYVVRVTRPLLQRACEVAARYNLGSHDSLVVAIAYRVSVPDIVSIDSDFECPDDIYIWNNDIPRIRRELKQPKRSR